MNIDQVFSWILNHKHNYPGRHQEPQPRTTKAFQPLEPKSQFHIIFKALNEYLRENLASGKSVNIRGFGAFTFEILSQLVKPSVFVDIDFRKTLDEQRAQRKHNHRIRPCFVVDPSLKVLLSRYHGKEELSVTQSQKSVYQQGFGMIFCNPTPIAAACYLGRETVNSALLAFVTAVSDLTALGYDLSLDFGFCRINIFDKNISYLFASDFISQLNDISFENKLKKSVAPTSSFWKNSYQDKWKSSTLSKLYKVPDEAKAQILSEKTLALKIMSLDMNSIEKSERSQIKSTKLPGIATRNTVGSF